jgi:hypothetical protein
MPFIVLDRIGKGFPAVFLKNIIKIINVIFIDTLIRK